MALQHMDILFAGMSKSSYIAAIDALDTWQRDAGVSYSKLVACYFDTSLEGAARLAPNLPELSIVFIANEEQVPDAAVRQLCRKLVQSLLDRRSKPLIVLDADVLDVVDSFADNGFTVDLRPDNGTVETALKSLVMEKA